eukprot:scaffold891_cov89-Skeletonema_dohrnii-CCMP3373.AAC.2
MESLRPKHARTRKLIKLSMGLLFAGAISLGVGVLALIVTGAGKHKRRVDMPWFHSCIDCIERDAERKANAKILQLCLRREMFSEGRSVMPGAMSIGTSYHD